MPWAKHRFSANTGGKILVLAKVKNIERLLSSLSAVSVTLMITSNACGMVHGNFDVSRSTANDSEPFFQQQGCLGLRRLPAYAIPGHLTRNGRSSRLQQNPLSDIVFSCLLTMLRASGSCSDSIHGDLEALDTRDGKLLVRFESWEE